MTSDKSQMTSLNSNIESASESLPYSADATSASLEAAFAALPDALYVFDQNRSLSKFNNAASRLQGPDDPPIEGRSCCEMFWRVEDTKACVVDRAVESNSAVEVEMLAGPEGNQPTLLIVQPTKDHALGGSAIVLARDISQLRRAEAEALEHKSFMASVAHRTPDEIYTLDPAGRITWMNERAEKNQLLMLAGRYFSEFIAANSRELTNDNLQRTLAGEETQFEVRAVRTDGTVRLPASWCFCATSRSANALRT